jgi:hypothetical protein
VSNDGLQIICDIIPKRDRLSITFTNHNEDYVVLTSKNSKTADFSTLTNDISPEDIIEVNVELHKTVSENKFSIYHIESFTNELLSISMLEILKWFSDCLRTNEHLVFESFDSNITFSTKTMAFVSSDNYKLNFDGMRNKRVDDCRSMSNFYNMNDLELIPEDFIIMGIVQDDNRFASIFGKIATALSLVYIASSASISDTDVDIQIKCQKTTSHSIALENIQENKILLSIYEWVYSDSPASRLLLAQNSIDLYCQKQGDIFNMSESVLAAAEHNYNLQSRQNIKNYLDLKKDIAKFIQEIVAHVGDYSTSIFSKFKKNLLAIMGFFFTVVLTRAGINQQWDNILTRDVTFITQLVIVFSFVYLILCIWETNYKLKHIKRVYESLKKNYEDVLTENELENAFDNDKLMNEIEIEVIKGTARWSIIWEIVLILLLLGIEFFSKYDGIITWLSQLMC